MSKILSLSHDPQAQRTPEDLYILRILGFYNRNGFIWAVCVLVNFKRRLPDDLFKEKLDSLRNESFRSKQRDWPASMFPIVASHSLSRQVSKT